MTRLRLRDAGLAVGELPTGPLNAITDVPGVRVGHTTLIRGGGALRPGDGPVRTGVTVILPHEDDPFRHKVRAAVHTINGFGKAHGFEQVRELGVLESPVALVLMFRGEITRGLRYLYWMPSSLMSDCSASATSALLEETTAPL